MFEVGIRQLLGMDEALVRAHSVRLRTGTARTHSSRALMQQRGEFVCTQYRCSVSNTAINGATSPYLCSRCSTAFDDIQPPWWPVALAKLQCSLRHMAASYPSRETTQGALLTIQNATSVWTTAEADSAGVKRLFRSDQKA